MSIGEHIETFAGRPVHDYDPDAGITDPAGRAHRLALDYDDRRTMAELIERFLADPAARQVEALVFGMWDSEFDASTSSGLVVAALAAARDRLPALRALFLGDIIGEECEISWIRQSDITPVLEAFPGLETLQVRGGEGLALGPVRHDGLRTLVFESGGLPAAAVRSILAADLPNLEHLELWLGEENYGGDATPDDLRPLLEGAVFPRLRYLGLRDSAIADQVAAALADAPIVRRVETLDLSLGNLGDDGALALVRGGNLGGLHRLDIHHHFVSDEVLDGLKALGIELDDSDRQEPETYGDETWRFIAVSE